jgi:hypothetical protein
VNSRVRKNLAVRVWLLVILAAACTAPAKADQPGLYGPRRITPNMTDGPIDKIEAARLQLQCAIRILDSEDVAAHTLAYAAYCLLRDLLDLDLRKLENALNVRELPEFLKHAKSDPQDILKEHSPETAHLTITLAILLWKMNNQEPTDVCESSTSGPIPMSRTVVTAKRLRRPDKVPFRSSKTSSLRPRRVETRSSGGLAG